MMKTLAATAMVLALTACGSGSADGNEATLHTGSGTIALSKRAPANLPAYAPVYPGATVVDSVVATPDGQRKSGGVLDMTTRDAAAKVMAFYDRTAAAAGLRKGYAEPAADDGVWMATYDDAPRTRPTDAANEPGKRPVVRSFNVTTEPAEGGAGTKISLMYQ